MRLTQFDQWHPQRGGGGPQGALKLSGWHTKITGQVYLSGVVEDFGLDVVAFLVHHVHLGMQLCTQLLRRHGAEGVTPGLRVTPGSGSHLASGDVLL